MRKRRSGNGKGESQADAKRLNNNCLAKENRKRNRVVRERKAKVKRITETKNENCEWRTENWKKHIGKQGAELFAEQAQ